jgi:polysaccharide export outer membrane protein
MAAACYGFAAPAHAVDLGSAIAGAAYGVVPRTAAEPAPRPSTPPAAPERTPAPTIVETPPTPQPAVSAAPVTPASVVPAPSAPMPATLPIPTAAPSPSPRVTAPAETAVAAPAPVARPWATEVAPSAPSIPPATQSSPAFVTAAPAAAWAAPAVAAPSQAQVVPAVAPASGMTTGPGSWDALRAGDALEIRFYRNNARQTERYLIQPGDILRIDVVDHPDVSRDSVTVAPDGYISAPLIGSVEAAGKTVDQVRQSLVGHYEAGRLLNPDVSVSVVSADQRIESLLRPEPGGGSPGMRVTVSTDGYLDLPFIPRIRADRPIDQVQSDIKAAYSRVFGPRLEVNANLVEHTVPVIYVAGQVTKPTEVPLVTPLTPVAAIGAAGGFLPVASPENVHVIRFRPDGSYKDFKFKLDADLKHSDPAALTFRLHPQDVVFVPKSGVAKANDFVEQYIRNMLPIPVSGGFVGF